MSVTYSVSQWRVTFPNFIWDNFYCRLTRGNIAYKVEEDHITFWKPTNNRYGVANFLDLAVKLQSKRINFRKNSTCQTALNLKSIFKSQNEAGIWKRQANCDELSFPLIAYFLFVMTFVEELFTNLAVISSIATPTVISQAIKLLKIFVLNCCLCYETWPFESWMRILTCTKTILLILLPNGTTNSRY